MMRKLLEVTEPYAMLPKSAQFPYYQRYRSKYLIAQIEDWNEDCVAIFYTFQEISRQRALRSGRAGSVWAGRFIVLYDSASPKMVIKTYFNFFSISLNVLELFECRRDDPYMTANWNSVHFTRA